MRFARCMLGILSLMVVALCASCASTQCWSGDNFDSESFRRDSAACSVVAETGKSPAGYFYTRSGPVPYGSNHDTIYYNCMVARGYYTVDPAQCK